MNSRVLTAWMWIIGCLMLVGGAFLLLGSLSRSAALMIAIGGIGFWLPWLPPSTPGLSDSGFLLISLMVMTAIIFLLGPGTYSLEARLFGRREIIIPPAIH